MPDDIKAPCLHLMTQVVKTLKSAREPEKVYDGVIALLRQVFRCHAAAIVLIDLEDPRWHTADDLPRYCSADSLEQVARVVRAWAD